MNLAIDFGNTRIKAGVFRASELIAAHVFDSPRQLLNSMDLFGNIHACIVGSVTQEHEALLPMLPGGDKRIIFTPSMALPLKNKYQSAAVLGSDRIAASIGSWLHHPKQPVLTVDAGTCLKYNFVNENDEFIGGAISPGIRMRLAAMHQSTAALPLLESDFTFRELTGTDTRSSLLAGAQTGAAAEIDGMITRYLETYPGLVVTLTGGDADYLATSLKSRFFAHQNLVLHGLNHILNLHLAS